MVSIGQIFLETTVRNAFGSMLLDDKRLRVTINFGFSVVPEVYTSMKKALAITNKHYSKIGIKKNNKVMKKHFALILPILMAMVCHIHSMYANTEATPRNPYMEDSQIRKIEIYGVSLQTRYKISTTIENLKQRIEYSTTIYQGDILNRIAPPTIRPLSVNLYK